MYIRTYLAMEFSEMDGTVCIWMVQYVYGWLQYVYGC